MSDPTPLELEAFPICTCRRCGKVGTALKEFFPGLPSRCRVCKAEGQREYRRGRPRAPLSPEARARKLKGTHYIPGVEAECKTCGLRGHAPADFYPSDRNRCIPCKKAERKANEAKYTPEALRLAYRSRRLKSEYGLTVEAFQNMLKAQDWKCSICGRDPRGWVTERKAMQTLHVDHDHSTGAVRALLCSPCNHALGQLQDSSALARRAADYLDHHKNAAPSASQV